MRARSLAGASRELNLAGDRIYVNSIDMAPRVANSPAKSSLTAQTSTRAFLLDRGLSARADRLSRRADAPQPAPTTGRYVRCKGTGCAPVARTLPRVPVRISSGVPVDSHAPRGVGRPSLEIRWMRTFSSISRRSRRSSVWSRPDEDVPSQCTTSSPLLTASPPVRLRPRADPCAERCGNAAAPC
ncbi:MAG: hypothetical protein RLZZ450_6581 [Pseudomonadota bacterium]|jgi:hypothetical protein